MRIFSTGQVADLLGVPAHRVEYLTRDRKIRPTKGPTGAFNWTPEDVRSAAVLLDLPITTALNCGGKKGGDR